jgi:hypothetical protein
MPTPLLTEQDIRTVKAYILLPLLLDTLELDIRRMRERKLKLADAYIKPLRAIQDSVTTEIAKTRREMLRLGIKPHDQQRDAKGLLVRYSYRGYRQEMYLLWEFVRSELEVMLAGYLGVKLDIDN